MLYPHNMKARDSVLGWIKKDFYKGVYGRKVHSLVALSGGLDSVALLATILTHTDHEVHAHHVDIRNAENRGDAENQALEKILAYMRKHYRPFGYSTSRYDMPMAAKDRVGADVSTVMFMLSRVNTAMLHVNDIVWTAHMKGNMREYMEAAAIDAACYTLYCGKPLWAMPFLAVDKIHLYTAIPEELAKLTWSCRFPIYGTMGEVIACNECHACTAVIRVTKTVEQCKLDGSWPTDRG